MPFRVLPFAPLLLSHFLFSHFLFIRSEIASDFLSAKICNLHNKSFSLFIVNGVQRSGLVVALTNRRTLAHSKAKRLFYLFNYSSVWCGGGTSGRAMAFCLGRSGSNPGRDFGLFSFRIAVYQF